VVLGVEIFFMYGCLLNNTASSMGIFALLDVYSEDSCIDLVTQLRDKIFMAMSNFNNMKHLRRN
jgi:hypothetical protein